MNGISEVTVYKCDFDGKVFDKQEDAALHFLKHTLMNIFYSCPEAEEKVDRVMKTLAFQGFMFQKDFRGNVDVEIENMLRNNNRIVPVVKFFCEVSGFGLSDSKRYIESVKDKYGI